MSVVLAFNVLRTKAYEENFYKKRSERRVELEKIAKKKNQTHMFNKKGKMLKTTSVPEFQSGEMGCDGKGGTQR